MAGVAHNETQVKPIHFPSVLHSLSFMRARRSNPARSLQGKDRLIKRVYTRTRNSGNLANPSMRVTYDTTRSRCLVVE